MKQDELILQSLRSDKGKDRGSFSRKAKPIPITQIEWKMKIS